MAKGMTLEVLDQRRVLVLKGAQEVAMVGGSEPENEPSDGSLRPE
jgi:hypothetical protein